MKNGDVREFVDYIYYGDEPWFIYERKKYFLEGWTNDGRLALYLYEMIPNGKTYIWNGKSFWDIEQDIEWVDC